MKKRPKDFPPLYLAMTLVGSVLMILWGFLVVGGYELAVVNLPSTIPLATMPWIAVITQFVFSLITVIGIYRYALLRIEYESSKRDLSDTIDSLKRKLQAYEPDFEDWK